MGKPLKGLASTILAGSILVIAGCQSPGIVKAFSKAYEGQADDKFQQEVYTSAKNSRVPEKHTIERVFDFIDCSSQEASDYAKAQSEVYVWYLAENQEAPDRVYGLPHFGKILEDRLNASIQLIMAFENLERIHKKIDKEENLNNFYEEIKRGYILSD
ncbi:hypothetical protein CO038_01090 [Candidatus Pacearchaeota archaeon CG_4_9_14_0_2_um_filter_39_13]|nr:hypothetical protein [Candidatus Pacearchaeota archaeon]OIO43533.1 MAG: hypothetical protein AUJ64_02330 [Candidatus Pacearchaeota archaeon CG1_02_39_14]PJC44948.1 MAG: hypothetical protein CO038_01090 [Candidatus Pacearchaeota archaeon CG_4_9_14_0_2_um_filter_39_13]